MTMSSKYHKGRRYEYKTIDMLKRASYEVMRSAASKGNWDLVAWCPQLKIIRFIQVKYIGKQKQKLNRIIEFEEEGWKVIFEVWKWGSKRKSKKK
jgi:Holliday junction resolvase